MDKKPRHFIKERRFDNNPTKRYLNEIRGKQVLYDTLFKKETLLWSILIVMGIALLYYFNTQYKWM